MTTLFNLGVGFHCTGQVDYGCVAEREALLLLCAPHVRIVLRLFICATQQLVRRAGMCAMSLARHRSKSIESCTTTQGASSKTPPNAQKISFERRDGRMQSSVYTDKNCQCIYFVFLRYSGNSQRMRAWRERESETAVTVCLLIHCTFMLRMSCAERLARLY